MGNNKRTQNTLFFNLKHELLSQSLYVHSQCPLI